MRIAITSDYIDVDNIGGAGRVLWELTGQLLRRGHEVSFLVGGPDSRHETIGHPDGRIEWCAFPYATAGRRGLRFLHEVRRAARRSFPRLATPDVVLHNQPLTADALGDLELPAVYLFHSPWPCEYVADRFGEDRLPPGWSRGIAAGLQIRMRRRIERRAVEQSQQIVTLSRHMRDRVLELYRVDEDRVRVSAGGVDTARFSPVDESQRRRARERWGIASDATALACVRRLVPRTGVELLIDAISLVDRRLPAGPVLVAGRGPRAASIEARIHERGLESRVRMLGYVSDAELPDLYRAADLTVVPTRALEGFGLSTLESLACGTPVVATPVGGTVEILEPFTPHLLSERATAESVAETLVRATTDPASLAATRSAARRVVEEHYSWGGMADGVVRALTDAVEEGRGAARSRADAGSSVRSRPESV